MMGRSVRGGLIALVVSCSNQTENPNELTRLPLAAGDENALERGPANTRRVDESKGHVAADAAVSIAGRWIVHTDPLAEAIAERVMLTDIETGRTQELGAVLGFRDQDYEAFETGTRSRAHWQPMTDKLARYFVTFQNGNTVVFDSSNNAPAISFPLVVETCHFAGSVVSCFDPLSKTVVVGDLDALRTWAFSDVAALHPWDAPLAAWTDTEDHVHSFSPSFDVHTTFAKGRLERVSKSGRFAFVRDGARATIYDALGGETTVSDAFGEDGPSSALFSDDEHELAWTDVYPVRRANSDASDEERDLVAKIHIFHLNTSEHVRIDGYVCGSTLTEEPIRLENGTLVTDATCSLGCPSVRWQPVFRTYDTVHGTFVSERKEAEALSYNDRRSQWMSAVEALVIREHVALSDVAITPEGDAIVYGERDVRVCLSDAACVTLLDAFSNDPKSGAFALDESRTHVVGHVDGVASRWDAKTGVRLSWR